MASQVHPIPYFTPSIFNFPPKCNTCLSQNELGTFPITSGNLPPLWVHCITIYHFHEAKILEAVLELQASLFSFPYTLLFLKKLSKLTDFPEIFPILYLSYVPRVRPLTQTTNQAPNPSPLLSFFLQILSAENSKA